MIGVPRGVAVYVFTEPCDMRKSFNTLGAVVEQSMKQDLTSGDLFLFVSRDRRRAKVLPSSLAATSMFPGTSRNRCARFRKQQKPV